MKFYSEGALRILATPTFLSILSVTRLGISAARECGKALTHHNRREMPVGQAFSAHFVCGKTEEVCGFQSCIDLCGLRKISTSISSRKAQLLRRSKPD